MARYALNMPAILKYEAEQWALQQDISLNQFILWAVAEKVSELNHRLDDPAFPQVIYRRDGNGRHVPMLRDAPVCIHMLIANAQRQNMEPQQIAQTYRISEEEVQAALSFYAAHKAEIDQAIAEDRSLDTTQG